MGVHIQVRDVPDSVFLALKARATGSGRSLSEFLRGVLEAAVSAPAAPGVCGPRSTEEPVAAHDH